MVSNGNSGGFIVSHYFQKHSRGLPDDRQMTLDHLVHLFLYKKIGKIGICTPPIEMHNICSVQREPRTVCNKPLDRRVGQLDFLHIEGGLYFVNPPTAGTAFFQDVYPNKNIFPKKGGFE